MRTIQPGNHITAGGDVWLKAGGIFSFAVALLHLVIIFVGAPAYRYFGAGEEMAMQAEAGSPSPALLTLFLVCVFAVFGCYAFSGARVIRRLPVLMLALAAIGIIYTLRGLVIFHQLFVLVASPALIETRDIVFSVVSLVIGATYLVGVVMNRKAIRASSHAI